MGQVLGKLTGWLSVSDEQAMLRVQQRDDTQAFAMLVQRWEGPIRRLCTRLVGDAHVGEDIVQEVFLRIYRGRGAWRCEAKFGTYLRRVAVNACWDELRRRGRRGEVALEADENGSGGHEPVSIEVRPAEAMEAQEQGARVRRAVAKLAEHYRVVVVLRHYEGLKYREIAEVLGIKEGTVKSRMGMALTKLRGLLNGEWETSE